MLSIAAAWAVIRFRFEAPFALPGPPLLGLAGSLIVLAVAVGLLGSAETFRRPPLDVLRWE